MLDTLEYKKLKEIKENEIVAIEVEMKMPQIAKGVRELKEENRQLECVSNTISN